MEALTKGACTCPSADAKVWLTIQIGKSQFGLCDAHRRLWWSAYGYGEYNWDIDLVRHHFYTYEGYEPGSDTAWRWKKMRLAFALEHFGLVDLEGDDGALLWEAASYLCAVVRPMSRKTNWF
jgi:hypothetical protein